LKQALLDRCDAFLVAEMNFFHIDPTRTDLTDQIYDFYFLKRLQCCAFAVTFLGNIFMTYRGPGLYKGDVTFSRLFESRHLFS
jgi:hypothetical protein